MALFSKNTLAQVSGFDNPVITGELVYNQKTYWNLTLKTPTGTVVNTTGATISAQIVRREISNLVDTRTGLSFDIAPYTATTPSPISMTVTNRDDANGKFTVLIDDSTWSLTTTDTQLAINANECVAFSGRIKVSFPALDVTPADDAIIFLLFLVRSDGVVVI